MNVDGAGSSGWREAPLQGVVVEETERGLRWDRWPAGAPHLCSLITESCSVRARVRARVWDGLGCSCRVDLVHRGPKNKSN